MLLEVKVVDGKLKNLGKKILITLSLNAVGNTKHIIITQLNNIYLFLAMLMQ